MKHFSDESTGKNTAQNTPKHAISREKIFFSEEGLGLSQTPPAVAKVPPYPTPPPHQAFGIRIFVPSQFQADLRHWVNFT